MLIPANARGLLPAAFALAGLAALTAAPAQAQNVDLIKNGGFESSSSAPWTTTGAAAFNLAGVTAPPLYPHTGNGYVAFYNGGGTLSQTVSTLAGADYTLSFYLNTSTKAGDTIDVLINGTSVIGGPTHPFQGALGAYTGYTFDITGVGGPTTLEFAGVTPADTGTIPTNLRIDDVSLVGPVPEASTTVSFGLLLALGMGGVFLARRKNAPRPA